jgi:hypothetical protein
VLQCSTTITEDSRVDKGVLKGKSSELSIHSSTSDTDQNAQRNRKGEEKHGDDVNELRGCKQRYLEEPRQSQKIVE